jgi:hypothetical protein
MLGYLRADNPGVIEAPPEGWYDTGDIVEVDEHRFVTILAAPNASKSPVKWSHSPPRIKTSGSLPGENLLS